MAAFQASLEHACCLRQPDYLDMNRAIVEHLVRRHKTASFRQYIARQTGRPGGVHKIARRAQTWRKPRSCRTCPTLWLIEIHQRERGQGSLHHGRSLARFPCENDGPAALAPRASHLTMIPARKMVARLLPGRKVDHTAISILLKECQKASKTWRKERLHASSRDLPRGRSAIPDDVGNEAFKLSRDVCTPYLEHLYRACLRQSYHPNHFRHATTVHAAEARRRVHSR